MIFEMLSGYPPFYDTNPLEIYKRIALGFYEFGPMFDIPTKQLIKGLLQRNITLRLGCLKDGAKDVMNVDWFTGIDWV